MKCLNFCLQIRSSNKTVAVGKEAILIGIMSLLQTEVRFNYIHRKRRSGSSLEIKKISYCQASAENLSFSASGFGKLNVFGETWMPILCAVYMCRVFWLPP